MLQKQQIVINRVRPMSDFANGPATETPPAEEVKPVRQYSGTLYLRLPSEEGRLYPKVRAIINMFPGDSSVVLYFADTRQRRGGRCALDSRMVDELKGVLGEANVVLK